MAVNINRGVDDAFYRYKMPKLLSKIEGKGNGIKTVIPNMEDIAKSLSRPPDYPTKFFGFELGAQTIMDDKNSRYIVNGAHDSTKLAELLDVFIKKYVLCASCGNPETDIVLKGGTKKEKDIYLSCKACGKVNIVDMSHKFCGFIQKNPPNGQVSQSKSKKEEKKEEKKAKSGKKSKKEGGSSGEDEAGDADENVDGLPQADDIEINETAEEVSKLEVKDDPAELFAKFLTERPNVTAIEVGLEASKLDLNEELSAAVLIQVLFESSVVPQFNKHKKLFQEFLKSDKAKKGALGGIERLVGVTKPDLLPKLSQILKLFYDNDIFEEEDIIAWAERPPSKKYVGDKELSKKVKASAQTLIEWLKNAEEESEEDEE